MTQREFYMCVHRIFASSEQKKNFVWFLSRKIKSFFFVPFVFMHLLCPGKKNIYIYKKYKFIYVVIAYCSLIVLNERKQIVAVHAIDVLLIIQLHKKKSQINNITYTHISPTFYRVVETFEPLLCCAAIFPIWFLCSQSPVCICADFFFIISFNGFSADSDDIENVAKTRKMANVWNVDTFIISKRQKKI